MTQRKRKDTTHDAQCEAALPDSEGTSGSDHTPPPLTPRPPTPTQQTHSFSLNASNARSHTLNKRASENVLSTNDLAKNISSPPPPSKSCSRFSRRNARFGSQYEFSTVESEIETKSEPSVAGTERSTEFAAFRL